MDRAAHEVHSGVPARFTQEAPMSAATMVGGTSLRVRSVAGADHVFDGHPDPGSLVTEAIDFLRRSTSAPIHSSREGTRS